MRFAVYILGLSLLSGIAKSFPIGDETDKSSPTSVLGSVYGLIFGEERPSQAHVDLKWDWNRDPDLVLWAQNHLEKSYVDNGCLYPREFILLNQIRMLKGLDSLSSNRFNSSKEAPSPLLSHDFYKSIHSKLQALRSDQFESIENDKTLNLTLQYFCDHPNEYKLSRKNRIQNPLGFSIFRIKEADGTEKYVALTKNVLGSGRFGKVKKGYDLLDPSKSVAVKQMAGSETKLGKELKELFQRNALRTLNSIDDELSFMIQFEQAHCKVPLKTREKDYIFSNFMYGKNARDHLTLYPGRFQQFYEQAKQLQADLHGRNIVHLDLHPKNFMFNPRTDSLQFIDFGLAKDISNMSDEQKRVALAFDSKVLETTWANFKVELNGAAVARGAVGPVQVKI